MYFGVNPRTQWDMLICGSVCAAISEQDNIMIQHCQHRFAEAAVTSKDPHASL
jgi:hypothetical protein